MSSLVRASTGYIVSTKPLSPNSLFWKKTCVYFYIYIILQQK